MEKTRPSEWSSPNGIPWSPGYRHYSPGAQLNIDTAHSPHHQHAQRNFAQQLSAVFALVKTQSVGLSKHLIPAWSPHVDCTSDSDAPLAVEIGAARSLIANSPIVTATHLVWWLGLDHDVHTNWSHCVESASRYLTINDEEVKRLFDEWTQWLQSHITHFLVRLGGFTLTYLAAQSESNQDFHPFDWCSFIAQTREEVVVRSFRTLSMHSASNSEWICPFKNISISHCTHDLGSALDQLSVFAIFAFWQQLSCIRITLDRTNPSALELNITSARMDTESQRFLRLILDGSYRWFSAMPNGMSTLIAESSGSPICDQYFGDYIGELHDDGMVEVTDFSWPGTKATMLSRLPYRWSWRFPAEDLSREHLQVDVTVHVGSVLPPGLSYSGYSVTCSSVHDKLVHVRGWTEEFQARLAYVRMKGSWMDCEAQQYGINIRSSCHYRPLTGWGHT